MKTLITSLAFTAIALFTTAQCHIDDWTGLKAFYDSTNGDNWDDREGWDIIANQISPAADCNLEELAGVRLDDDGRVRSLNLGRNRLNGIIPTEIGKITNLSFLDLAGNDLTGNIPAEIGNLTSLTEAFLNACDFNGSIPSEIGNMTNLAALFLSQNQLTGFIPVEIGNLTNIRQIVLDCNELAGSIPSELGKLPKLQNLHLEDNQLTGSIPVELGNAPNLRWIYLSDNQLTGSIPSELENLSVLNELHLNDNQLSGSIPPELGNLGNLEELHLNGNQLSGNIPAEFVNLIDIEKLNLSNNQLSGCYPDSLTFFCNDFSNAEISDGNNFDTDWEDFCSNGGACPPVSTNSYPLNEAINFVYNHSSQTLNITSSNFPVEYVASYNSNGQLLKEYKINPSVNIKIDVADLPVGLYVMVAIVKEKVFQTKLVVQK